MHLLMVDGDEENVVCEMVYVGVHIFLSNGGATGIYRGKGVIS